MELGDLIEILEVEPEASPIIEPFVIPEEQDERERPLVPPSVEPEKQLETIGAPNIP